MVDEAAVDGDLEPVHGARGQAGQRVALREEARKQLPGGREPLDVRRDECVGSVGVACDRASQKERDLRRDSLADSAGNVATISRAVSAR